MIEEFSEQHIVPLRTLLGQFMDRHCYDSRDRVFSILNLSLVYKINLHGYMKADYSLSREDVFFIVFAF